MALKYADRVNETTTTTGTGTLDLDGAQTGHQSFVEGIGTTNTVHYCISDGVDWEVGEGTVTGGSPDTLSRDTVYASSNADALVNWGAGTRSVFVNNPAIQIQTQYDNDLTSLSDTVITAPLAGQILAYDAGGEWTNQTPVTGVTDHLLLSNIGTNSHAQIDTHMTTGDAHIADAAKHREINDLGTTVTELFSANKINAALLTKSETTHHHNLDYVNVSGDTMTGQLTGITPVADGHLTRKDYVDGKFVLNAPVTPSGTSWSLSSIPSTVRRITLLLYDVGTDGSNEIQLRLGDSGGMESSGYIGITTVMGDGTPDVIQTTSHFAVIRVDPTGYDEGWYGEIVLTLVDATTNRWMVKSQIGHSNDSPKLLTFCGGGKALTTELTQLELLSGDNFNQGSITVIYE